MPSSGYGVPNTPYGADKMAAMQGGWSKLHKIVVKGMEEVRIAMLVGCLQHA